MGPLVYVGNSTTAARLGCTPAECSCFFSFQGGTTQVSTGSSSYLAHEYCLGVSARARLQCGGYAPVTAACQMQPLTNRASRVLCAVSGSMQACECPLPRLSSAPPRRSTNPGPSQHGVQEAPQGWLSSWSQMRRTGRPASSCTFKHAAEWSYGQPRCECVMPEPAWLQREHPQPWRTVKQALVMKPPKGAPTRKVQGCCPDACGSGCQLPA